MTTTLFLQVCLHLFDIRLRVAFVSVVNFVKLFQTSEKSILTVSQPEYQATDQTTEPSSQSVRHQLISLLVGR